MGKNKKFCCFLNFVALYLLFPQLISNKNVAENWKALFQIYLQFEGII